MQEVKSALQVYRTEWLTKPTNQFGSMLEANRGAAILTTAFAESRLAHGTHVPTITDTPALLMCKAKISTWAAKPLETLSLLASI